MLTTAHSVTDHKGTTKNEALSVSYQNQGMPGTENRQLTVFLETPKTFQVYLGCHKFLHI